MALLIPQPELYQEDAKGDGFVAEKPIMLSCGPVTFPDGSALLPEKAKKTGYFLFRQQPGAAVEVWTEKSGEPGEWVPDGARQEPSPLAYQDNTWQMVLVAMGQKDKDKNEKIGTDVVSGYPKYFVRCFFQGTDSAGIEQEGTSAQSHAVEIFGAGTKNRAGLLMDPPEPPTAEEIRLFLKDQYCVAEQGIAAIREKDSGFEIELSVSGATILITNSGDIEFTPAPSKQVTVNGGLTVHGNVNVEGEFRVNGIRYCY